MISKVQQIPMEFTHKPFYERQDFLVAKSNLEAVKIIDEWPNWANFAVCIYGHEGSGKTHLAHIFMENVYKKTNSPYKIPQIHAKDIKIENIYRLLEENKCLVIENLSEDINEEAIFHLYNLYKNEGGYILFTSKKPPARMDFKLPDLQSRLNSIPAVEIKEPDGDLLSALIIKLFSDRQLNVSPEIVNYITNNAQRSFAYIKRLVVEIDSISISKKRAVSIPIIKEAIISLGNNQQGLLF
ncbi:MAG: hypothetical protein LBR70_02375 [Lactobacillaceae bacterium]|jgi:chromosomal replication initiation ATPase DnaA|nr:hypothetical protein [Lactobacillaceae bacterium]